MEIEILYKDEHIAACIKPVGVDSEGEGMPKLLSQQLGGQIYPIHRLDKAVGGVMVFARTKPAAGKLSAAVAERELDKEYLAVVGGKPEQSDAVLEDLLYRDAAKNKSFVVKRMRQGVKAAKLEYRLLETVDNTSLLRIKLYTGRSHQIRVQFSSRAMPLLGDIKYGSKERRCSIALWSCRLAFNHPRTGEPMEFNALPPQEFPWNNFKIEQMKTISTQI